ncbi:MAG: DEAD/DEAH box helicase, partial [Chloroflexi bacterium]|nr:DEAD/DEAH box helicase [Chloroflexota bacterium]
MNVFAFRDQLIADYADYINSFILIQDQRIKDKVWEALDGGALWPEPLIQLNPSFEPGAWIDELVDNKVLHDECRRIFRRDKDKPEHQGYGCPLRLHKHQHEAIRIAQGGHNYVLTTGTGSGKSLAYIVPIVDHVLRRGSGRGIQAIVVYPMNALANSQAGELTKFLSLGYPDSKGPVTFARYTGQESDEVFAQIEGRPPDIILTNYVMLELILTRTVETPLIRAAQGLQFLVLDELHTYRGRQGADRDDVG